MKLLRIPRLIFLLTISIACTALAQQEECTLGVAAGKATQDGRPLLWKVRDNSSARDNAVYYNASYQHKFISVITVGSSSSWMGLNEKGFAIVNSSSNDLSADSIGLSNGTLMREALGTCATVAEFQALLDATNVTGRQTRANFAVIDSTGAAAIFETGGNVYWKFDANDPETAPQGYVLRTNFAINGGGDGGIERYRRQNDLIADFYTGDSLTHKSILRYHMRDFSDFDSNPVPVPYPFKWRSDRPFGYIYCYLSICRSTTVSAAVIHGVFPEERASLSTMWTILGQSASGIAVPYWPVGPTPTIARANPTARLCDIAGDIRTFLFDYADNGNYIDSYRLLDGAGVGLWTRTFPAEDSIITATAAHMEQWRATGSDAATQLSLEAALADYAYTKLSQCYYGLASGVVTTAPAPLPVEYALYQNYPNPVAAAGGFDFTGNPHTSFRFSVPVFSRITLKVFNILGEEIATVLAREYDTGQHTAPWRAEGVPAGIYFYRMCAEPLEGDTRDTFVATGKLVVVK